MLIPTFTSQVERRLLPQSVNQSNSVPLYRQEYRPQEHHRRRLSSSSSSSSSIVNHKQLTILYLLMKEMK
jgi:hypothetical protein